MKISATTTFAALALCASQAGAVTLTATDTVLDAPITSGADLMDPTSVSGNVRIDFVGNDLDGTAPNSRSPYDATAYENTAVYHSVSAGAEAVFTSASVFSSFALMWGSPDTYNKIAFFLNGSGVGSFDGSDVIPPGTGGLGFVDVLFTGLFDEVRLSSVGQDAFEFTNVSAVPLPAAGWLLVGGIGGLAAMKRRKKAA